MTFEEFQLTRRHSDRLARCSNMQCENGQEGGAGLVYLDHLCIRELPDGKFHLTIEDNEWVCDRLEVLERRLYEFAVAQGHASEAAH